MVQKLQALAPIAGEHDVPIGAHEVGEHEKDFGGKGEDAFVAFEDRDKLRNDEKQEEDGGADGHHANDARIYHGADDHLLCFKLGIEIFDDAFEHVAEGTGEFGGLDHVDVEGAENFGVFGEGIGEGFAGLDVLLDLHEDFLELWVLGLVGDALEGGADTDAGLDHDGELVGEIGDVLKSGSAADGEVQEISRRSF